jgi:Ca-activated chloride channel family protein
VIIMRVPLLLGLCLAVSSIGGRAQSEQRVESPVLTARTDLVTLTVTVVDERGVPVTGLRREQFIVYDNGQPQSIQFFTSEDVPASIGVVVDCSGSMHGQRDGVLAAVEAFTSIRQPLDEFFALNFNEVVWPGWLSRASFTHDANQLRTALLTCPSQGMTALYDALDRGLDEAQLASWDRKALVVISDGGDNASSHTLPGVREHARRTNVVIYGVTLFDPNDPDARPQVLKMLARDSGGRVLTPERPNELTRAFAAIASEIRTGYTMAFTPSDTTRDEFRPIRVVVKTDDHRRVVARTRAGYYGARTTSTSK